jgi:hypothetical protein
MGERVWLGHHRLKTVLGLGEVVGRILAGLVVLLIPFGVRSAFADPSGPRTSMLMVNRSYRVSIWPPLLIGPEASAQTSFLQEAIPDPSRLDELGSFREQVDGLVLNKLAFLEEPSPSFNEVNDFDGHPVRAPD